MAHDERLRIAREALAEFTRPTEVGDLLSETVGDDGVTTLEFATATPGYPGWRWTVSIAQVDGEAPTVLEAELLPGDGALLAPDWVPWSERLEEYRAHQAELAAEAEAEGEAADDADELDDDDLDEDEDADDEDADDEDLDDDEDDLADDDADDFGDDPDDGIDFESDDDDSDDSDDSDDDSDESDTSED